MKPYHKYILAITLIVLSSHVIAEELYINEIPDFTQSELGELKGDQYCAPVAVSNSIVWLSNKKLDQMALIEKLGSSDYMNTCLDSGTDVVGVINGVHKIAEEIFGKNIEVEYQGWRPYKKNTYKSDIVPDINRIQSAVSKRSAAWINVGWYKYDEYNNQYRRIGGHWVTLVGSKSGILIVHDPAPRAGKSFSNEYVNLIIIESGTLTGKEKGLPVSAKGFYKLGKGMHVKSSADVAIIDGAVFLRI